MRDACVWAKGLAAAVISAAATCIAGAVIDPAQIRLVLKLAALHAVWGACAYLQKSPIPGQCTLKE